jgi:hypothetical protein
VRKILFTLISLALPFVVFSQRKGTNNEEAVEYSKIFAYGATTNTSSGLLGGFVLRHSNLINVKEGKTVHRYAALELVNIRHPKENNLSNNFGNRVSIGKKNYLFAIRPEYGREWFLFRKGNDEGVGLSAILATGPTIGIEKPYYIKYQNPNQDRPETVPYNPDIHTNVGSIIGAGSIWQGFLKGAKVVPGVHVKTALNLDMNTFGDSITGFEFGFTFDYFLRAPEIIAAQIVENKPFYASGYVTLYFGNKRINK